MTRILHISPDFNYSCGVSRYVFSILKNFSRNGSYKLYFITNGGDSLERLEETGITPFIIKFSSGLKNLYYFLPNLIVLVKYCVKNKIDIIHTHHRYPEFLSYLISKMINVKTISTVHSLVEGKNKFSFKSDRLIAVSKTVEKMLRENFNIPAEKIIMLYNSIEPFNIENNESIENIREKYDIPQDGKIILFLGRISKIKGIDLLIEAFNKLHLQSNKLFLLIVGQIYDKYFDNILKNLSSNIIILNPVKNPYMFYSFADLIVLPSREESFSYIVREAGLFKKPFIGSNTGGIAEFIDDGINGLLFEKGNVLQLSEKIQYLLNNTEEAKVLGENLFIKVKKQICSGKYYETLSAIYNNMIEG